METPKAMKNFNVAGDGPVTLAHQFGLKSDFAGCYVLVDESSAIYVGISKNALRRLRQHVREQTRFDASLAYRIAAGRYPHKLTKSGAMTIEVFRAAFDKAKDYLRSLSVAFIEIPNPLALYLFEPYCAMKFDTNVWNTFETH